VHTSCETEHVLFETIDVIRTIHYFIVERIRNEHLLRHYVQIFDMFARVIRIVLIACR
jgi:hypothetical protein